jgi:hypothetical protein
MTTATSEPLFDYTPTQEEEIERLKALAGKKNAQMQALLDDPIFVQFSENQKVLDKKMKEFAKLRDEVGKITDQIQELNVPDLTEPTQDGFYIFTHSSLGYRNEIRIYKTLVLKALGTWFDLENCNSMTNSEAWRKNETFTEFLGIDKDSIEVLLSKVEDETQYPFQLLKVIETASETTDERDEDETV